MIENTAASITSAARRREIAMTVERTIDDVAPYAEKSEIMGASTWMLHDRVVSLVPLGGRSQLHFWQGEVRSDRFPGMLKGQGDGAPRYVPLTSMLDVDGDVKELIREAFDFHV